MLKQLFRKRGQEDPRRERGRGGVYYKCSMPLSSLLVSCVWIFVFYKTFRFTTSAVGKANNEVVCVYVPFRLFPEAVDLFPTLSKPSKQGTQTSGAYVPPLTHTLLLIRKDAKEQI